MPTPDPPGTPADPAAALAALLAEERARLLAGDLAALPTLIAAKERLLTEVGSALPASAETLVPLRAAAAENQGLLEAALRGLRAARDRLEAARNGGPALSTYDASGRASTLAPARPSVERRA